MHFTSIYFRSSIHCLFGFTLKCIVLIHSRLKNIMQIVKMLVVSSEETHIANFISRHHSAKLRNKSRTQKHFPEIIDQNNQTYVQHMSTICSTEEDSRSLNLFSGKVITSNQEWPPSYAARSLYPNFFGCFKCRSWSTTASNPLTVATGQLPRDASKLNCQSNTNW